MFLIREAGWCEEGIAISAASLCSVRRERNVKREHLFLPSLCYTDCSPLCLPFISCLSVLQQHNVWLFPHPAFGHQRIGIQLLLSHLYYFHPLYHQYEREIWFLNHLLHFLFSSCVHTVRPDFCTEIEFPCHPVSCIQLHWTPLASDETHQR